MKLTAGLVSAVVLLSSAAVEAVSMKHSHHHRHIEARDSHLEERSRGKGKVHKVTVTVTSTKTKWVDPTPAPKPKEEKVKVESKPKEEKKPKKDHGTKFPHTGEGLEREFPDGEIDCSHFPSDYGAVPVPWVNPGSGGWSGLQRAGGNYNDCVDNTLCSFACPPGWLKAQWPEDAQPASGESHGGLRCKGGKLYKTHSTYKTLCIKGHGGIYVTNKLDQAVPICQTDYPGTENMCVPTYVQPGQTLELSVPVSERYYVWRGKKTSTQFYVNPAGTPLEVGCNWGKEGGGIGNWSPIIFGASYDAGQTWISMSHNQLNGDPSNFNIRITGDQVNGKCTYDYKSNSFSGESATDLGCTAAVRGGKAYYELF